MEKREAQLREKRYIKERYTYSDYKKYIQNSGFGQPFAAQDPETKSEKLEKIKKRNEYGMAIRQQNLNHKDNNSTTSMSNYVKFNSRLSEFSNGQSPNFYPRVN